MSLTWPTTEEITSTVSSIFEVKTDQITSSFSKSQIVPIHPSLIISWTLALAGKNISGMQVVMTPVLYAAWLGFLINFLNLLPAWQLDGGHLARATLGSKWHRLTTYASIGILFILGYWVPNIIFSKLHVPLIYM